MERRKLTIEFADNGIILRNPDNEDDVVLALTGDHGDIHYGHRDEYIAIGKTVYDWLTKEVVSDHAKEWIATGAELVIVATLTGREY